MLINNDCHWLHKRCPDCEAELKIIVSPSKPKGSRNKKSSSSSVSQPSTVKNTSEMSEAIPSPMGQQLDLSPVGVPAVETPDSQPTGEEQQLADEPELHPKSNDPISLLADNYFDCQYPGCKMEFVGPCNECPVIPGSTDQPCFCAGHLPHEVHVHGKKRKLLDGQSSRNNSNGISLVAQPEGSTDRTTTNKKQLNVERCGCRSSNCQYTIPQSNHQLKLTSCLNAPNCKSVFHPSCPHLNSENHVPICRNCKTTHNNSG